MNMTDSEFILQMLNQIESGELTVEVVGHLPYYVYSGGVQYKCSNGWTLWVFDDCGDWDYLESAMSPEGLVFEWKCFSEDLKYWRPQAVAPTEWHWAPHGHSVT